MKRLLRSLVAASLALSTVLSPFAAGASTPARGMIVSLASDSPSGQRDRADRDTVLAVRVTAASSTYAPGEDVTVNGFSGFRLAGSLIAYLAGDGRATVWVYRDAGRSQTAGYATIRDLASGSSSSTDISLFSPERIPAGSSRTFYFVVSTLDDDFVANGNDRYALTASIDGVRGYATGIEDSGYFPVTITSSTLRYGTVSPTLYPPPVYTNATYRNYGDTYYSSGYGSNYTTYSDANYPSYPGGNQYYYPSTATQTITVNGVEGSDSEYSPPQLDSATLSIVWSTQGADSVDSSVVSFMGSSCRSPYYQENVLNRLSGRYERSYSDQRDCILRIGRVVNSSGGSANNTVKYWRMTSRYTDNTGNGYDYGTPRQTITVNGVEGSDSMYDAPSVSADRLNFAWSTWNAYSSNNGDLSFIGGSCRSPGSITDVIYGLNGSYSTSYDGNRDCVIRVTRTVSGSNGSNTVTKYWRMNGTYTGPIIDYIEPSQTIRLNGIDGAASETEARNNAVVDGYSLTYEWSASNNATSADPVYASRWGGTCGNGTYNEYLSWMTGLNGSQTYAPGGRDGCVISITRTVRNNGRPNTITRYWYRRADSETSNYVPTQYIAINGYAGADSADSARTTAYLTSSYLNFSWSSNNADRLDGSEISFMGAACSNVSAQNFLSGLNGNYSADYPNRGGCTVRITRTVSNGYGSNTVVKYWYMRTGNDTTWGGTPSQTLTLGGTSGYDSESAARSNPVTISNLSYSWSATNASYASRSDAWYAGGGCYAGSSAGVIPPIDRLNGSLNGSYYSGNAPTDCLIAVSRTVSGSNGQTNTITRYWYVRSTGTTTGGNVSQSVRINGIEGATSESAARTNAVLDQNGLSYSWSTSGADRVDSVTASWWGGTCVNGSGETRLDWMTGLDGSTSMAAGGRDGCVIRITRRVSGPNGSNTLVRYWYWRDSRNSVSYSTPATTTVSPARVIDSRVTYVSSPDYSNYSSWDGYYDSNGRWHSYGSNGSGRYPRDGNYYYDSDRRYYSDYYDSGYNNGYYYGGTYYRNGSNYSNGNDSYTSWDGRSYYNSPAWREGLTDWGTRRNSTDYGNPSESGRSRY